METVIDIFNEYMINISMFYRSLYNCRSSDHFILNIDFCIPA